MGYTRTETWVTLGDALDYLYTHLDIGLNEAGIYIRQIALAQKNSRLFAFIRGFPKNP